MKPLKIFISYSHNQNDRPLLDQLLRHLAPLVQTGKITVWEDSKILPSDLWDKAIKDNLEEADIVVLLVSSDYTASDYINRIEVPVAMKRHREDLCVVVPVLLRSCLFDLMPYSIYEFLPKKTENQRLIPVDKWENTDDALEVVVRRLNELIKEKTSKNNSAPIVNIPTPATDSPHSKDILSELERKGYEQHLNLATQKLQRLQSAHLLETDASRQFAYEQEIQKLEMVVADLKSTLQI